MTADSSLQVAPRLSFQVTAILSPESAPGSVNCRQGSSGTRGAHEAVNTILSLCLITAATLCLAQDLAGAASPLA